MRRYTVDLRCLRCGETHRAINELILQDGPTKAGSLAELYPGGELPPVLAELLRDLVWCQVTQEGVSQEDRARVYLIPKER